MPEPPASLCFGLPADPEFHFGEARLFFFFIHRFPIWEAGGALFFKLLIMI